MSATSDLPTFDIKHDDIINSRVEIYPVSTFNENLIESFWGYSFLYVNRKRKMHESNMSTYIESIERLLGHEFIYSYYARILSFPREQRKILLRNRSNTYYIFNQDLPLLFNSNQTEVDWILEVRKNT